MKLNRITTSVAFVAAAASIFSAGAANAMTLRADLLDTFGQYVNEEGNLFTDASLKQLNPGSLSWNGVDPIDVFFVDEGAGFRSSLDYSINGGQKVTLFDDISSTDSVLSEQDGPLDLGEGRRVGAFSGPTSIDFFLNANSKFDDTPYVYGADAAANPDGLQHMVAFEYYDDVEDQFWTIIGFEDLYGELGATGSPNQDSDRDFNDVVFAVRGVQGEDVAKTPEPSALLAFMGLGLAGGLQQLRRKSETA